MSMLFKFHILPYCGSFCSISFYLIPDPLFSSRPSYFATPGFQSQPDRQYSLHPFNYLARTTSSSSYFTLYHEARMITQRQLRANRRNAKKSTGPRTPEGRTACRPIALKNGLAAADVILPSADAHPPFAQLPPPFQAPSHPPTPH